MSLLSKFIAIALFIIFTFLGFYLGIKYQERNCTFNKVLKCQNQITQKQAVEIVRNLPEVKNYLKMLADAKAKWIVNAEEREDNSWMVQVAEVVKDSGEKDEKLLSHTATFNWYKIDKNNGKVIYPMFLYDKKGKLIGSGDTKEFSN